MTESQDIDNPLDRDDPYTRTELSHGLEAVSNRLDQTEDHFGGVLEKVSAAVLELRDQVAQLLKKEAEKDIEPRPWVARATPAQWAEMAGWVDWMQASYGVIPDFEISPCWPAHIGLAEELAGLHHSWKRAQISDELGEKTGSNDLTGWHDRWLWPFLQRIKGGHYRMSNCREMHQHESSRGTAKPTDRQYLPGNALGLGRA